MPIEKSAGAVIFYREGDRIFYLLLHYPSSTKAARPRSRKISLQGKDYWDFPKGHIEEGEKLEDTVKREIEEETGLVDIKFVEGFKEWIKYFFKFEGKNIFKIVTFLLAETKTKEAKISWEHIDFKWLSYEESFEQLTFKNAKEILKKANDFLRKRNRKNYAMA
jgi:8-oxo-dGTP pyrophosphatase MutT (NUDIX family)